MSIQIMLKELRLTTFSQNLEDYQRQATESTWSYSEFLSKLCEQELARRFQTRVTKWTRESRLPAGKSFANLNFADLPKSVQQPILQLKDNHQWASQADNVLLIGPSGVGKSHIAAALGYHLIERGVRVKWLSACELVQQLQKAKKELNLMTYMTRLDKYPVLIIDDMVIPPINNVVQK